MSAKSIKYIRNVDIRPFRSEPAAINILGQGNDEINFSTLLKSSVYATIKNRKHFSMTTGKNFDLLNKSVDVDLGISLLADSQADISGCANQIIANALHIPRSLYCPFCAADFMFEFTLKDHLKRRHGNEIMAMAAKNKTISDVYEIHTCPFCSAVFYHFTLIPLHLAQHHDPEVLRQWQAISGNMTELMNKKDFCPSIELVCCSPDMSKMLGSLDISGAKDRKVGFTPDTPTLKSILKRKTNISGKIIFSPSSASLRRIGGDMTRRSNNSVRRELRFDLPAMSASPSPVKGDDMAPLTNPLQRLREEPTPNKKRRWYQFGRRSNEGELTVEEYFHRNRRNKNNSSINQPITSTPISFLDGPAPFTVPKTRRRWLFFRSQKLKVPKLDPESSSFRPSFYASERFGCRFCHSKYYSNAELLIHLKKDHGALKRWFGKSYECGECRVGFRRNFTLVRHCNSHHTPKKRY